VHGADVQALQARMTMHELQKEKQKELLSEVSGWDCGDFAIDVPGADADELLARSESLRQNR